MTDSKEQSPRLKDKNPALAEPLFEQNIFKYSHHPPSISSSSDNEITEIIVSEETYNDQKYKVMKINMPDSSKSSSSYAPQIIEIEEGSCVPTQTRSMEDLNKKMQCEEAIKQQEQDSEDEKDLIVTPEKQEEETKRQNQSNGKERKELIGDEGSRKRQKIFEKFKSSRKQSIYRNLIENLSNKENGGKNRTQKAERMVNFEKKRENQTVLKNWNYKRIQKIQFHRSVIEQLNRRIDLIMKESLQHVEIYKSFFQQRAIQEQLYIQQKLTNTQNCFQNNQIAKKVYINTSCILNVVARRESQQKAKLWEMVDLLNNEIVKDIYEEYLKKINKELLGLREKISDLKLHLEKAADSVCNKLIQLETLFTEVTTNVTADVTEDFFEAELNFLRQCQKESNLQIKLGHLSFEYFKAAKQQQKNRRIMIKSSLFRYIRGLKEYYKKSGRQQSLVFQNENLTLEQSSKDEESNLIQQIFSLQEMLNTQQIQHLQLIYKNQQNNNSQENNDSQQNKQTPGQENRQNENQHDNSCSWHQKKMVGLLTSEIEHFLTNIDIQQFNIRLLVMKKFQITIYKQGRWVAGQIVLTIDRYVHIFVHNNLAMRNTLYGHQSYPNMELSLRVRDLQINLMSQKQDQELEIQLRNKSESGKLMQLLLRDKINEQRVKFINEDDLLEFEDYLKELE